jgi:hypothetical protein
VSGLLAAPVRAVRSLRDLPPPPDDGRLSDLITLACLGMVPLALVARVLLPSKYFTDGRVLQSIATGEYLPLEDTSFLYVGRLYALLGMANSPLAAGALGMALAIIALWAALRRARGRMTPAACFLVIVFAVLASVYLSQFSKDVWVLPITIVVLLAPRGWRGDLLIVPAMVAYASFFRQYWFLVLGLYLLLRVVTAWRARRRLVVLALVVGTLGAVLVAPAVLGEPLAQARSSVNLERSSSADAVTAISPVQFGANAVADTAENLVTLAQLVVPTPLAAHGSPIYLGYLVLISCLWGAFGWAVLGSRRRLVDGRPTVEIDDWALRCALLVLAFLTTQSYFEPDYGSYLKHLAPVLPLLVAAAIGWRGTPLLAPPPGPAPALRPRVTPPGDARPADPAGAAHGRFTAQNDPQLAGKRRDLR